ncbi:glucokinase [Cribrihabitans sp. XS_ASV171]
MTRLVADIGGTNARLAIAQAGAVRPGSERRYANDGFAGFEDLAARYLSETQPGPLSEIVVAVAGPVGPGTAQLTNRGWGFDAAALAHRFGAPQVLLMNDLAALGQALGSLGAGGLRTVCEGDDSGGTQALVAGIGTGFNTSLVLFRGGDAFCARAETGHVSLPHPVAAALKDRFGDAAPDFPTVEECFSGRGFARLQGTSGEDITGFYGHLIGLLARELRLAFMPDAGLYFAGSVARAILTDGGATAFGAAFHAPAPVPLGAPPPVRMIMDDMAALKGCASVTL